MKNIFTTIFVVALLFAFAGVSYAQTAGVVENSDGTLTAYDPTTNSYVTTDPETATYTLTPAGTSVTPNPSTVNPGLPNTGFGGDAAATSALIASTGLIAVLGAVYLMRRQSLV